jgi:hypothetical protein
MAITHCPECGEKLSSHASQCPHCGIGGDRLQGKRREAASTQSFANLVVLGMVLGGMALIFYFCMGGKELLSPPTPLGYELLYEKK